MRTRNNKNIQNMKQKDIDIYEILKGMPDGTRLYTSMCGDVIFTGCDDNKETLDAIMVENKDGEHGFDAYGKYAEDGEVLLFPSKEMRDWSKFFKTGDVLESERGICIFEAYEDDWTKLNFTGRYSLAKGKFSDKHESFSTLDWVKSDHPAEYIKTIEERLGGKLNLETLEIEKPAKLTFEIGKLYVFHERDEDGELTIIGKLISKNESEDTLRFGYQYEIETEKFVTDQAFDLRISVNTELREATEDEADMFKGANALWEKKAKGQPDFKTFDKVLVSIGSGFKWRPALFIRDHGENFTNRYNVLPLYSGKPADFEHCIPYEGNENIAFADYNSEDLPLPF